MQQGGDQPRPRKAAIEHQQVVVVKPVEALEQHLPLADQGTVQNQRIEQLDTRPQQAEQDRLAHATPALAVKQRQANLRCVGGQNPQSLPERLIRQRLIDQPQQLRVEQIEDIGAKTAARLRERAGGDHAAQAAAPGQQREERIEFALHGAAHAGEQKGDQMREGQIPFAREIPRIPARRFAKGCALNKPGQPGKHIDIFRPSYLTYKYQSVTTLIIPRYGSPIAPSAKYVDVLSHEDCVTIQP